jgi:hypothetical protein
MLLPALAVRSGQLGLREFSIEMLAALLFLPSPVTLLLYPLNVPAWSLLFELLANAAYGATARLLTDVKLVGVITVFGAWLTWLYMQPGFEMPGGGTWGDGIWGFPRVGYSFFAGVAVHLIWRKKKPPPLPLWLVATALVACFSIIPGSFAPIYALVVTLVVLPVFVWLGAGIRTEGITALACSWLGA